MSKVYCKYCLDFHDMDGRRIESTICKSRTNLGTFYSPKEFKLTAIEKNKNNDCPDFRDRRVT